MVQCSPHRLTKLTSIKLDLEGDLEGREPEGGLQRVTLELVGFF